jgi:hypothetical protein
LQAYQEISDKSRGSVCKQSNVERGIIEERVPQTDQKRNEERNTESGNNAQYVHHETAEKAQNNTLVFVVGVKIQFVSSNNIDVSMIDQNMGDVNIAYLKATPAKITKAANKTKNITLSKVPADLL